MLERSSRSLDSKKIRKSSPGCSSEGGMRCRRRLISSWRSRSSNLRRKEMNHVADELREMIRQEMENKRGCEDKQRIKFLISDGIERLKRLDETLDMQGR
ncbi:hypothetical protein ACS0TY_013787 [Phlomoides rotata]